MQCLAFTDVTVVKQSTPSLFIGETCEVMIEVNVDKDTAYLFNSGEEKIEDILVLHLEGGKDLFVSFKNCVVTMRYSTGYRVYNLFNL